LPVSNALGEEDWDDWEDDARHGARNQFRWSLQALACEADDQLTLFPDFTCKPDELTSDYDNWSKAARSRFAGLFSDDQLAALRAIDSRIDAMSRRGIEFEEELWRDDALGTRPEWEALRALAKLALKSFGWPTEKPPWGRSLYARGDSDPV
jgi:hypothetical protein